MSLKKNCLWCKVKGYTNLNEMSEQINQFLAWLCSSVAFFSIFHNFLGRQPQGKFIIIWHLLTFQQTLTVKVIVIVIVIVTETAKSYIASHEYYKFNVWVKLFSTCWMINNGSKKIIKLIVTWASCGISKSGPVFYSLANTISKMLKSF